MSSRKTAQELWLDLISYEKAVASDCRETPPCPKGVTLFVTTDQPLTPFQNPCPFWCGVSCHIKINASFLTLSGGSWEPCLLLALHKRWLHTWGHQAAWDLPEGSGPTSYPPFWLDQSVPPWGQEQGQLHPEGPADIGGHLHSNCQPKQRKKSSCSNSASSESDPETQRQNTHKTNAPESDRKWRWPAPHQTPAMASACPHQTVARGWQGSANHLHTFHPEFL